MKKSVLLGVLLVLISAIVVYGVMAKTNKSRSLPSDTVTLSGETVCLPVKDPSQPHILVCAIGLKADDGKHYALQSQELDIFETGKRVKVTGTLTSPEAGSIYDTVASMLVSSYEEE